MKRYIKSDSNPLKEYELEILHMISTGATKRDVEKYLDGAYTYGWITRIELGQLDMFAESHYAAHNYS